MGGSERNRLLKENGPTPTDNVTGAVGNDHCLPEHKFRIVFATGQWRRPPRSAGTCILTKEMEEGQCWTPYPCGEINRYTHQTRPSFLG